MTNVSGKIVEKVKTRILCSVMFSPKIVQFMVYLLTYPMVQSPSWEANWFAASQEIPRILWNPKLHYRSRLWYKVEKILYGRARHGWQYNTTHALGMLGK